MLRLCLVMALAAIPLPVPAAEAPPRTDGDLYVMGVALDQEPNKASRETIDSYNWCPEEIEKVFREQAAALHRKVDSKLILGGKATHQGVMDGLEWLRKNTHEGDLAVLYVGCHGFTDPKEGWGVVAADGKKVWGHEIKAQLAQLPCQAVVLIETCTSGGFAQVHKDDPPVPDNVTALCACSSKQSVDNQLDMAVAEALYGRADFNHDGVVDLDELIRYVRLRYREWRPAAKNGDGGDTPVIVKSKEMPGAIPLTKASPELAAVVHNGAWYGALEEKQDGDKYRVHLLGWANRPGPYFVTASVPRDFICLPSDGKPMLVEQDGTWYPARQIGVEGEKYKVHYIGYNEDEVVAKGRVKYPFVGDPGAMNEAEVAAAPAAGEAAADAGSWEQVGAAGAWKPTVVGATLKGNLYTVETNNHLWETDLDSGEYKEVGKPEFGNAKFLFAAGDHLYMIGKGGSLFRINPRDGERRRLGDEGAWKTTLAGAVLKGKLYTTEDNGGLYVTNLETGEWSQIGKAEFGSTKFMLAAHEHLYSIEQDGSLYKIDPDDGSWGRLGDEGAWKGTLAGAVLKGRLYTTEDNGGFYETDLESGAWTQLGKAEFGTTAFMFAAGDHIYTIEQDGSLYRVNVK